MLLCSGPFCTSPGLQSVAPNSVGTYVSEKSSFALSSNSTRIVSSFASCVAFDCLSCCCLISFGLSPVWIDFDSSLARPCAAIGLP